MQAKQRGGFFNMPLVSALALLASASLNVYQALHHVVVVELIVPAPAHEPTVFKRGHLTAIDPSSSCEIFWNACWYGVANHPR